jgi:DNA-binding transcriptional regulator/RsmH inhibitor MraZ
LDVIGPQSTVLPGRQPLGLFTVSIDSNGRMKLPVKIKEFLDKFSEKTFFCTSLDGRIGLIYPIPVWDKYHQFLDSAEDRARARRVKFRAQVLGAEADVDSQGRITLPPQLRAELKLQSQQDLRLVVDRGVVQILTQSVYDEMNHDGGGDPTGDVNALEEAGMGKGI